MNKRVLCMDIGTSSIKAGLIDETGNLLWFHHDPILPDNTLLQNWTVDRWTDSLSRIMKIFAEEEPGKPDALVLSGNGPTIVPLGRDGRALSEVMLWLDPRRAAVPGTNSFYLPKAAWFRNESPAAYEKTWRFASCPEYLNFELTGELTTISPNASFDEFIWNSDEIRRYGLDPAKFPQIVYPGSVQGRVRAEAAAKFGLAVGLPVIAGGSDFMMSLVGTATLAPGRTCDRAGSSEGINHCARNPVRDARLRTLPHAVEGLWNVAGILASTGLMFEWFRGISGQADKNYESMLSDLCGLPVDGDYPFFFPNHEHGASWEFSRASFLNLKAGHGRVHLGRAVVESIGFSILESVDTLHEAGLPIDEIRVCGGQSKNAYWNQMKADICGKPILVPRVKDAELMGDAIMGFMGLGVRDSVVDTAEDLFVVEKEIIPRADRTRAFRPRYEAYRELADRIAVAHELIFAPDPPLS